MADDEKKRLDVVDIADVICRRCRCDPDRAMAAAAELFQAQQDNRFSYVARVGSVSIELSAPSVEGVQHLIRNHEISLTEQPRPVLLGGVGSIR